MCKLKREKILLFYNPYSGNGLFKNNLDLIIERFQQNGYQIVPVRSAKGLAIEEALEEMDPTAYRQVVVAGGDGTINLCVNAMIKNNIDLPLAVFPTGTANDFAYYFDLPNDIEGMVDVAMENHTTFADVGVCNGRYFINVAAMGALVDVSQKTDPNLKNTLGTLAYYMRALGELTNLKALPVTLTTPDQTIEEEIYFMLVMNGKSAGGFKKISPESNINDGKLDVILFRKMPIIEFGPLLVSVMQGNHPNNKHVLAFQTESLKLESSVEISTDVDGEKGEPLPLDFSLLHNRLRVFTPKPKEKGKKK